MQRLLQLLGLEQVLVMGGITSRVMSLLCHPSAPTADMCKLAVFAMAGHSPDLFDAVSAAGFRNTVKHLLSFSTFPLLPALCFVCRSCYPKL